MPYKSKEALRARNRRYYQENKETIKASVDNYRQENAEQIKINQRVYRSNNKKKLKEKDAKYRQQNLEHLRERERKYAAAHAEENRARAARWYAANPARGKANARVAGHKRRARIAKVGGKFTKADIRAMGLIQWMRCYYCSIGIEKENHIDHMTPLSRGGSNWVANLCLTCPECNLTKHTQTAEEFIEQKGFMNGI